MSISKNRQPAAKKYAGALGRPMPSNLHGEEKSQAEETRMRELFTHYGVREGDHKALARHLAESHVPGFSKSKRGAKRKDDLRVQLLVAVLELRLCGLSNEQIFLSLVTEKGSPWYRKNWEALKQTYYSLARLLKGANDPVINDIIHEKTFASCLPRGSYFEILPARQPALAETIDAIAARYKVSK